MAARLENPYDVLDQADEDLDALASAKAAQAGKRKGAAAASTAGVPAKAKETQPQGACIKGPLGTGRVTRGAGQRRSWGA